MTLALLCAGALAVLWLFTRVCVWRIERAAPPLGAFVDVGEVRLHLLDMAGAPGAPTVVLIHGASGNLRDPYFALQEALGERFRVIAVDRPGNGYSTRGPSDTSNPARQADVIAQALAQLGVSSFVALGHSWGAAVAAALALRHPGMVAGLVLVAPATHPWPGGVSRRVRFFAIPYIGRAVAEFVVVPIGLRLALRIIRVIFRPEEAPPDYARRIGALLSARPAAFVANCRDVVDFYGDLVRLSARYDEIRAPTEIIAAERDIVVSSLIHAYGLARDIPGARLTVLAGAGHMPHWTRSGDVVQAIERVVSRGASVS